MRIHVIACGGAVMHNLTIALSLAGHQVTGSDDEIYNPAKEKLEKYGLLPIAGWYPEKINESLDLVIVGMHAKRDNAELSAALELKLKVMSYPEFIAHHARNKKRIVIAGSHGKTTTTAMIMHVLKEKKVDFDYLVGAPLEGFHLMIRLSDAPLMVIEGDEYLSAPTDPIPKIWHYKPHLSIITGIAWDHINVFPTYQEYTDVFKKYLEELPEQAIVYHYKQDADLNKIVGNLTRTDVKTLAYEAYPAHITQNVAFLEFENKSYGLQVFGSHNLENIQACVQICKQLGLAEHDILQSLTGFRGAAKRMQLLHSSENQKIFLDFAHAPSKARATLNAVREQFPESKLIAILELHTFSSLNKDFIPLYAHVLDNADMAAVFFNKHTLEIKRMPDLDPEYVISSFGRPDLLVFRENTELEQFLLKINRDRTVILFMSSGTFNGLNLKSWATENHF